MDDTNKKSAIPLRERIVRKAKEKATLTLHELTINPRSTNQTNDVTKSPSVKRNNRSYKPFPELNNQQKSEYNYYTLFYHFLKDIIYSIKLILVTS